MTQAAHTTANARMAELRQRYIDQISSLRDTVKYYLHLEALSELNAAARQKLSRMAHKIAGSGGTYGFSRLSAAARRVEQLADDPPKIGKQMMRHALVALLEEIDALAVTAPDAPPRPLGEPPHPVPGSRRPSEAPSDGAPGQGFVPPAQPEGAPGRDEPPAEDSAPQETEAEAPQETTAPEQEEMGKDAAAPGADHDAKKRALFRPKIYIVEDDPVIADILKASLADDFDVVLDPDGEDIENAMGRERPDLLVLDDTLPRRSGIEILQSLQADRRLRNIPAVMLTATTDPANVMKALEAGAANYFTKPFDAEGFVDYLRFVLNANPDTVLIVDDDEAVRDLLADTFSEKGLRTAQAESGLAALRLLRDMTPGLVVLDSSMPGVEGGPVLNELRRTPQSRKIPVVMLTSPKTGHDAVDWLRRGAVDYVAKPFNPEEVALRGLRAMGREDLI